MGRRPDPEYIRALKGKSPRLSKEEQLAWATDLPLPPDWLDEDALACWDRMASELHAAGILFAISRDKLARYCQAYADYSLIMAGRKRKGKARFKVPITTVHQAQFEQKILSHAEDVMKNFESEYGLTPASATKIRRPTGGGGQTPREKFDKFLEEGAKS